MNIRYDILLRQSVVENDLNNSGSLQNLKLATLMMLIH